MGGGAGDRPDCVRSPRTTGEVRSQSARHREPESLEIEMGGFMNAKFFASSRPVNRFRLAPWLPFAALFLLASPSFAQGDASAAKSDTPAALPHVARATQIAGNDLTRPLFQCRPDGGNVVATAQREGSTQWLEPTKAFDNVFFVGNNFVGVWIVRTSDGLVLFDSTESTDEARDHLVPGLRTLGLDPAQI